MNEERMLVISELLDSGDKLDGVLGFNMAHYLGSDFIDEDLPLGKIREIAECGTTACVAGWASWLYGTDEDQCDFATGKDALDLTMREANRLFLNDDDYITDPHSGYSGASTVALRTITRQQAAAAMRRMVEEHRLEGEKEEIAE